MNRPLINFKENSMASSVEMCAICAWRENCNKKFSLSGRDVHCADFSEDFSLKKKAESEKAMEENPENE